jgi:structural maintenance of chromosome 4
MRSTGGSKARSKAVRGILKAASKGGELSKIGVLGRLGDLAAIPEKYDVAVSTACGMLDHIVVQTTAGAQRCLEFLRKHNLGRASFIPLDKQKKGAHDRAVETPEGAPRLFELIVPCNFAITPALYLAVGNTLVAPDLETASRWAYDFSKRWRVVTLDGKLIETAGTMSGGGKSVRRGGMLLANSRSAAPVVSSEEDSEAMLERLEKEAEHANSALQECRRRRLAIKELLRTLTKAVKSLDIKLPKLQMEISGCDTTREELTKLIPELREQSEVSEEESIKLVELRKNVEKCKSGMKSCVQLASELEKEVSKMQKDILEAGGPRFKKQKATCDKVVSNLNEQEKQLNSSKVEVKSTEKAATKAKAAGEAFEKELEECQKLLKEKEEEFNALEEGAFEVMTAYEQVKKIEEQKRSALEKETKEAEDLKNSQSEVRCVEIDLLGQLEAFEKQVSENQKKKRRWEKEIERLRKIEDESDFDDEETEEEQESTDDDMPEDQPESDDDMDVDDTAEQAASQDGNGEKKPHSLSQSVLEKYHPAEIEETIETLQSERNMLAKNANMGAITEYRKKEADYLSRVTELDQVTEERNEARKEHEELRRQRLEMFMEGFGAITLKLKEMYQMITLGGDAELELVDSLDPFSEGIVFSVRPPKKSWKNISNLSGGEKTLSSLSLVFALHHYKPTPLYVMDEIDAALDFKNVSIVANYIKERTKNAQFIIISLRNNMFELADRLVGIYKTNNCTKSVTIDPRAFGVSAQQNGRSASAPAPLVDNTNTDKRAQNDTNTEKQGTLSVSTRNSSPFFSLDNSSPTFFQSQASP